MAEWNLSVALRGQGDDLSRKLRRAATDARALGAAARGAQNDVRQLGDTADTTGRQVRRLGADSQTAARQLRNLTRDGAAADRTVTQLGGSSVQASGRLEVLARQAGDAARDMRRLERALAETDAQIRALARNVRIAVQLNDDTGQGVAAVRAALARLEAQSPLTLAARIGDDTAPGAAAVRAAVRALDRLGPVRIASRIDNGTGPGATAVRAAVRSLDRLGPVQITARVDDRTGPGITAVRASAARLQALSPIRLNVRFDGNAARIAAAAAAMRDLRDDAQRVGAALGSITPGATTATAAINRVQRAAADASRALRELRNRASAAANELEQLRNRAILAAAGLTVLSGAASDADGRLNSLSGQTRTLRSDTDDLDAAMRRLATRLGGLRGSLSGFGGGAGGASDNTTDLIFAVGALATALLPVAASLMPIVNGLLAAGVGIGAFGLAIGGQIKTLMDGAEAQKKYDEAVEEHGKHSQKAAEAEVALQRELKKMPPATREAAAAWSSLTDQYMAWSDSLAGSTMPVATKSMAVFADLFPKLTPFVQGAARELDRFVTIAAGGVRSDSFNQFMTRFAEFSEKSLRQGNDALIRFTRTLDTGTLGGNYREFMDYAKANGPLVAETLGELTRALIHLLAGAADVGVGMLTVVNALAKLINAVPTEVITTLLQLAIAIKAVRLAVTGGAAIGTAVTALATAIGAMRVAAAGATGPMAGFTAALATLSRGAKIALASTAIGLIVVAAMALSDIGKKAPPDVDKLTSSLGKLATTGKVSGEAARAYGADFKGLGESLRVLARPSNAQGVQQWMTQLIGMDSTPVKKAKEDLDAVDKSLANMVKSGNAELAQAAFDEIAAAMQKQGMTSGELRGRLDDYKAALADQAFEQEVAARAMGLFGDQAIATSEKLNAQKASADGLRQAIVALNDVNRAALGGMIGFEASIDAAAKAAEENAGSLKMVNGELDLNSPKAQAAATALADLGAKTDEAATAARESGKSWDYVNGIYERGTSSLVKTGMQMGLTKGQAQALADQILQIPDQHATTVEMHREDAIAGLNEVIGKIEATPKSKSVTVNALTKSAIGLLESLGYKTKTLPDGRVQVTARTGAALGGLAAVKRARDALTDRTITITTHYRITGSGAAQQARRSGSYGTQLANADGNIVDYYAQGGLQQRGIRHFANGGGENHVAQIAPAGTWRVWAEDETGGEAYIPLAASKRPRSRAIAEETVRRLGGKGIAWNVDGGVNAFATGGFTYTPTTLASLGTQDARGRFDDLVGKLRTAWTEYNAALKSLNDVKKNKKSTKAQIAAAQRKAAAEYADVKALDKALGLPSGAKAPTTLNLTAYQKQLTASVAATEKWQGNLAKIGRRGGADVQELLQAMGESGYSLVNQLAGASDKQFKDITAKLLKVGETAKASLADFTQQANVATAKSTVFQANLAKLAAAGYGDLAQQLAGQGDEAAQALAAEAVKSPSKAASANAAAKKAGAALTGEQVQDLVAIIAAVKTSKTGIHDIAGTTGLGEDVIIEIAGKATAQIKSALGSRATKLLADLARGQKGLSYADGGIRAGMYATQGGIVRFAEPQTGGEAYIPLGASKRGPATRVLADVATRFGLGMTDASAGRPVVIIRQGGDTHVTVQPVRMTDSASGIAAQVGRQVRRANRGGVAARAGS